MEEKEIKYAIYLCHDVNHDGTPRKENATKEKIVKATNAHVINEEVERLAKGSWEMFDKQYIQGWGGFELYFKNRKA